MSAERQTASLRARVEGGARLVAFYGFSALFLPVIVLIALIKPGDYVWYRLARVWARVSLAIFGIRVESFGAERLGEGQDYVLLVNHRSHFDSLAIVEALGARETRWVAKRELLKVPLFGYGLRVTGQILVDRSDHSQAVDALRAHLGDRGATIVFFAEGARSESGELSAFKKGGAAFAIDAKLPVVPVAVAGSEKVLRKHSWLVTPGRIRVAVGEPISTRGMTSADRERLTALARDRVAALLADIEPAGAGA
jgi:1-acyl-sn-glycerol-3-phosphate acyltransferase